MPSPKQVSYILSLLDQKGFGSRFMNSRFKELGATMRERSGSVKDWVESLSVSAASELIGKLLKM